MPPGAWLSPSDIPPWTYSLQTFTQTTMVFFSIPEARSSRARSSVPMVENSINNGAVYAFPVQSTASLPMPFNLSTQRPTQRFPPTAP